VDLEFKHNRAIALLKEKGHNVAQSTDGNLITVDGKQYRVLGLAALAEELHPQEWTAIQRKRDEELRGKRT
jgi:hypothetical protein